MIPQMFRTVPEPQPQIDQKQWALLRRRSEIPLRLASMREALGVVRFCKRYDIQCTPGVVGKFSYGQLYVILSGEGIAYVPFEAVE